MILSKCLTAVPGLTTAKMMKRLLLKREQEPATTAASGNTPQVAVHKRQDPGEDLLVSKQHREVSDIQLSRKVSIGGNSDLCVIAGPCSIESKEQIIEAALAVKKAGGTVLRGGAYKPRTSPYAFQGLGLAGLKMLREAGDAVGLPVITEVMDADDLPAIAEMADIIQIGARNCQNFSLLKKVGRVRRPVVLKRGMMMTISELLMSAEYIMSEGNQDVILCERGIRTFETETRNTLDISAIPVLKAKTHLPVIVDPSHAAGKRDLVKPLALAAIAAGADGVMIEAHPNPAEALCDGAQSLTSNELVVLGKQMRDMVAAISS